LGHSFSKQYYDGKIQRERLDNVNYHLFPMPELDGAFPDLFVERSELRGVNVTIPHKISVMRFLDEISEEAQAIGAVNCVVRKSDGRLKGHNTDAFGFEQSLRLLLGASKADLSALVLGNGGAARAVTYVLGKL